ncbi:MAG: DNA-processing protein DprA [Thermomicrobiales bacterium]
MQETASAMESGRIAAMPETNRISPATRLALILTLRLDGLRVIAPTENEPQQPLDAGELTRLARWLQEHGRDALALPNDPEPLLDGWSDHTVTTERIVRLLARQDAIDRAVARWTDQGIWVLGRKDPGYPRQRLTARLGDAIPPVLFGVGDRRLLARGGTAIVGSRDTHISTLTLAQELGAEEARADRTVISGGARGVDERAVQGAFLGGGTAVVILGDALARSAAKVVHADHLARGMLALISPYAPDAAFSTANAMGRNRLIYCMADESIVVASSDGRGGTFAGAREALRHGRGTIWVAPTDDPRSGNPILLHAGARPLAERPTPLPRTRLDETAPPTTQPSSTVIETPGEALYKSFLACWRSLPEEPFTMGQLEAALGLTAQQTRAWVFQAVEHRDASRLTTPVRYAVHPAPNAERADELRDSAHTDIHHHVGGQAGEP